MRAAPLLACLLTVGCAAGDPDGPGGAGGKADDPGAGSGAVRYASAVTVASLLYEAPGTPEERERSAAEMEPIFGEAVSPPFQDRPLADPLHPWTYLKKMSALGYYGPLGPYGPLGIVGPLGDGVWNPALYISGLFFWADWSDMLAELGGPLSAKGPLGDRGPLNTVFWDALPERMEARLDETIDRVKVVTPPWLHWLAEAMEEQLRQVLLQVLQRDFVTHLQPGGMFAALGPVGVSGALGPLGPLGPIGAHGYARGEDGGYWPEEGSECHHAPEGFREPPCRKIEVEWTEGGERRTYDLVEHYDEESAASMADNDTSFFVSGEIESQDDTDRFEFHAEKGQWVTVVVIPEFAKFFPQQAMAILGQAGFGSSFCGAGGFDPQAMFDLPTVPCVQHASALLGPPTIPIEYDHRGSFDDFDLELDIDAPDEQGRIVSNSGDHVDWIHVWVPAGTTLSATISRHRAWQAEVNPFDPLGADLSNDGRWGLLFRPSPTTYRLYVVGSAGVQTDTELSGPYIEGLGAPE